jgi:hypothetical protein
VRIYSKCCPMDLEFTQLCMIFPFSIPVSPNCLRLVSSMFYRTMAHR